MLKPDIGADEIGKQNDELVREAKVMAQFDHPNVLGLVGMYTAAGNVTHIVVDLCRKGSLRTVLRLDKPGLSVLVPYTVDIAEGMVYLASKHFVSDVVFRGFDSWMPTHSVGLRDCSFESWSGNVIVVVLEGVALIAHTGATPTRMHVPNSWMPCSWQVHRDLATRNVLVSDVDRCLICDFGMSRGVRAELDTGNDAYYVMQHDGRLPVRWLAPEAMAMERKKFSEASDVYVGPRLLA